jgi:23S rRNA maturation mini-RNase III
MTESEQLAEIKELINHLTKDVEEIKKDVEGLKEETLRTNDRVETYQKASQQVVNLAFSLILAATAAIVIPTALGR